MRHRSTARRAADRAAGKVDANQAQIVKKLRDCAVKVEILSDVGKGVPDLLAGFRGVNVLLEVKDGDKTITSLMNETAKAAGTTLDIVRYVRFERGEGIEKRKDDLAAEIAAMKKA